MRMRFRTLKGMHNFDPQARILLRGGCFAAGLYGCEETGVTPDSRRRLRAEAVAGCLGAGKGRCPVSCSWLLLGRSVFGEVGGRLGVASIRYVERRGITP